MKRHLNKGQCPQYYVEGTHEGIISKADYEKVQKLFAKKTIKGENNRSCTLSQKVYCSICGAVCFRKARKSHVFVWHCRTHAQSASRCPLKSITEAEIRQAFLSVYNRLQTNRQIVLEPIINDLLWLRQLQEQQSETRMTLGEEIQRLAKQKHNLTRIHALGYIEESEFMERSISIEQQIREKKQQLARRTTSHATDKALYQARCIQKILSDTLPLDAFDDSTFTALVQKVQISNTQIQFELTNGMKLSESRVLQ